MHAPASGGTLALMWRSSAAVALCAILGLASAARAQRHYTVRAGDTLVEIARRHRVGVRELRRENRLPGDSIRAGMRLRIPGRGGSGASSRAWDGVYTVRQGDTLSRIARRFSVSIRDLQRRNRLRGTTIRPGTRLRIPGRGMGRQRPEGARPAELDESQEQALERAEALGLGTSRVAHALLDGPPEPAWIEAAGEPEAEGTLLAPVEGGVFLRGWGSGPGGYHLALDIGAEPGTEIRASARGVVAYAGRSVRGYGNVVILVHPNGWVTWYAHNRQNLVVPGERVERGQPIGTVGSTGYARGAHVHFMLVHEGEHCDAMPLLEGATFQGRGGETIEAEHTSRWTGDRPTNVRCAPKAARPHPRHRRRRRVRRARGS